MLDTNKEGIELKNQYIIYNQNSLPKLQIEQKKYLVGMLIFQIFRPQPLLELILKRLVLPAAAKETSKATEEACKGKCGVDTFSRIIF